MTLYDPAQAGNEHGEKLFFQPHLFVYNTPTYEIGPGSPLMLVVPFLEWEWPEERVAIWNAYPDVLPGDLSITPRYHRCSRSAGMRISMTASITACPARRQSPVVAQRR